jgi:polyphosphate kinase
MSTATDDNDTKSWLDLEVEEDFDEEQEIDDSRVPAALRELQLVHKKSTIDRAFYFRELLRLQSELVKLQDWVSIMV